MAHIHFTSWLRELVPDGPLQAAGGTVGEALATALAARPQVRGYVLDERGQLRKHVCVFADGMRLANTAALGHAIGKEAKLYVMQALSGG
jgi:molybdopterin synthase sulfur carrier subunit